MSRITVRFFGGASEAFGGSETTVEDAKDLSELVSLLVDSDPDLQALLDQCSYFVDGEHHRSLDVELPSGCRVDVLPPFAGG